MYKKLFSETIIYGFGAVAPRLINFLLTMVFTAKIAEEEFAIFANLYAAVSIINVIITFGFETSYFRFSKDKKEKVVFNSTNLFLISNALFFFAFVCLFMNPIASFSGYELQKEYLYWFAAIIALDTICVIPYAWLRFHNKPIQFTAIKLTNSFVSVGLTVLLLYFYLDKQPTVLGFQLKQNVSFPFFANLIASFITVLALLPILIKIRLNVDFQLFKRMLKYSFPIMLAGLAFTINENFDKLIQKSIIGDFDAGAYGACYKLAALMTIFVTAFRMGVEPFLFKQMDALDARKTYATILEFFTIAGGIIVVGIIANISWLQGIFIKSEGYRTALGIVPIIIIANLFYGIYHNLSVWYKVNDKTYYGTIISWIGALFTLFINLFFLHKFGFMASAWATVIAYGIMMVLSYYLGQKQYKIPYKTKKIVLYMFLTIALSTTNYYLLDQNVFSGNLFLLLYIGFVYYLERNHLLKGFFK